MGHSWLDETGERHYSLGFFDPGDPPDDWCAEDDRPESEFDPNCVDPDEGCVKCGECRADRLVWDNEGVAVTCATCGTVYVP